MKIFYKNVTVISQNKNREIFWEVDLLVDNGVIASMGKNLATPYDCEIINQSDLVVTPGLINTHVHLGDTIFAFLLKQGLPLNEYLRKTDELFIQNPEIELHRDVIANYTLRELIKTGTTAICGGRVSGYASGYKMENVSGVTLMKSEKLNSTLINFNSSVENALALVESESAIFIQSLNMVSDRSLEIAAEVLKKKPSLKLIIHIAETKNEQPEPILKLIRHGLLNDRAILVHCNWLTDWEVSVVAKNNAKIVHCFSSNINCADRILDLPKINNQGIKWAVATDGLATSWNLDLLKEIQLVFDYHNKVNQNSVNYQELFDAITCQAAEVLGLDDRIGSIEVGKRADIVVYKHQHVKGSNIENLIPQLNSGSIYGVLINGKSMLGDIKSDKLDIAFNYLLNKIKSR